MKKRTHIKRMVTKICLNDCFFTKPEEELDYVGVIDQDIRWLRGRVQDYAGRNKIEEHRVSLNFEQVELSEEEYVHHQAKQSVGAEDLYGREEL